MSEKSRRSPASVSVRIRGARARVSGRESEMYERRRERRARGPNAKNQGLVGAQLHLDLMESQQIPRGRIRLPNAFSVTGRYYLRARRRSAKIGENEAYLGTGGPKFRRRRQTAVRAGYSGNLE